MDIQYLLALQSFRDSTGGLFNSFFLFITQFGEILIPVTIAMIFYYAVDKKLGSRMLLGDAFAIFVNGVIKLTACVYRPWVRDARIVPPGDSKAHATGYSFPSGHAMMATGVYGTAAVHYRKQKGLCAAFLVLLVLVFFSRNYLGVHTPQDVLVGFAVAALAVYLLNLALDWAEKDEKRDLIVLGSAVLLATLAAIFFTEKSYPMELGSDGKLLVDPAAMVPDAFYAAGLLCAVIGGWVIERRFIQFSMDVSVERKILRCLSGALVFYALNNILFPFLIRIIGARAGCFFGAFIGWFYVVAVHPAIFKKCEARAE